MGAWKEWTRREGKRFVFEIGMVCNILSLVLIFIAFCSPYWIVSWPRVHSGFKKVGLWEVCFSGMVLPTDPSQKAYHGCWWILAPEFFNIRGWLMPAWFIFTQVSVTLCFCAEVVGTAIILFIWLKTGGLQIEVKDKNKKREGINMLQTAVAITCITGLVMVTTMVMFASMFVEDRNWLPNPYLNYLSWSYGLALVSAFFSVFAMIGQVTYVMIVRQEMREPPRDMSMAGFPHPLLSHDKSKDTTFA